MFSIAHSVAQIRTYFGGGTGVENDPYIIATVQHLVDLQDWVKDNDTTGVYFKQTADIDFTDKDPWGGIGVKANTGSGNCFSGVYDGQGYEITGLKLVRGKTYNGLFTQVDGGTVKNLVVTLAGFGPATGVDGEEFGGAVIGNVCGGGLIENVTAKGFLGTVEAAPNHNVAGIAVSLMKGTLLNCTNEANVISAYTKVGGICAITQTATPRIIQGCVNKGTVRGVVTFKTEQAVGGILAYSNSGEAEIIDCENYGSVVCDRETTQASCAFYEGQLCGQSQGAGGYITCKGVNKVLANQLAADASEKDASKAFSAGYATVDGDIATIIPVANLAAGNTYKLMVKGLTPAFVLAADGDTIAFNTNLCEAVAFNVTAGDESLEVKETAAAGIVTFTCTAIPTFTVTFTKDAVEIPGSQKTVLRDYALKAADIPEITEEGAWDNNPTGAVIVANITFNFTVKSGGWHPDPTKDAGKTAEEAYGIPSTSKLAGADAVALGNWAANNTIDFAAFQADPDSFYDAFLLDTTKAGVDEAKKAFKITSITQDSEGNWIVKVTGDKGDEQPYNANALVDIVPYTGIEAGDDAAFFQATLKPIPPTK